MRDLREQLYELYDELRTDTAGLAAHAQARGAALRRRRRRTQVAAATLTLLAAASVIATSSGVFGPRAGDSATEALEAPARVAMVLSHSGNQLIWGEASAAAAAGDRDVAGQLRAGLEAEAAGTITDVHALTTRDHGSLVEGASAIFAPADGSPHSVVTVSFERSSERTLYPNGPSAYFTGCHRVLLHCKLERLPDRSVLRTGELIITGKYGPSMIRYAERWVGEYVVVINASAPPREGFAGAAPALTVEQLAGLAARLTP